ncbi:hypothetical protein C7447_10294 [Tenacibaculum adriaticum]|uniref:Uncharacterized protein n=1 Tax=Tenacibaculum adriaticum TaxID=413713 RepID=A0A5S5DVV4_9FLAO|nr:hypothetical protein [Tenacibaculum adriaticum]TYP98779.1 hypothetical protein C7447_10294 [Tenacibaculum adriaticum]
MDDKLHTFFAESSFDTLEPHSGHEARFLRKLEHPKKGKNLSWKWMSIAASVVLFIGFYLGSSHQKYQYDLASVSPKMAEAQSFFVSTINQELKEIEKYRNLETESIIEDSLNEIEELEDNYKNLRQELKANGNERHAIQGMITNYQQRLEVLEKLLIQLELLNNPERLNIQNDEII